MGGWEGVGFCVICLLLDRLTSAEDGAYVESVGEMAGLDNNAMNKPTQWCCGMVL